MQNSNIIDDLAFNRDVNEIINNFRDYLTKEEFLCISLYKNAIGKQNNRVHKVFIKKYQGKVVDTSTVTKRIRKMFKLLPLLSDFLRFKRIYGMDYRLKDLLTKKQYRLLILYEKRKKSKEICDILNIKGWRSGVENSFKRILKRLERSNDLYIQKYLEYLSDLFKFSRKYKRPKSTLT